MKKQPILWGIILIFLLSSLVPNVIGSEIDNPNLIYDDIEIIIRAGVEGKTNGNYGLGWVFIVNNYLNYTISGTINVTYKNFREKTVFSENGSYNVPPFSEFGFSQIDWIHFPYPILNIEIIVNVEGINNTKSGMEIGPIVIFIDGWIN